MAAAKSRPVSEIYRHGHKREERERERNRDREGEREKKETTDIINQLGKSGDYVNLGVRRKIDPAAARQTKKKKIERDATCLCNFDKVLQLKREYFEVCELERTLAYFFFIHIFNEFFLHKLSGKLCGYYQINGMIIMKKPFDN